MIYKKTLHAVVETFVASAVQHFESVKIAHSLKTAVFYVVFKQQDNDEYRYEPYQTDPSFLFVFFLFCARKFKVFASMALRRMVARRGKAVDHFLPFRSISYDKAVISQ